MNLYKKAIYILGKKKIPSLIGIMILVLIGSVAELLGVSMILPFVNAIMDTNFITGNYYLNSIYEKSGFTINGMIILLALAMILVYVIKNLYLVFMNNEIYKFTYTNQRNLAVRMMEHYMEQPYIKLREQNSSDLIRNITSDSNKCFVVILNLLQMTSEAVVSGALIVFLFATDVIVTLSVVIMLSISMLLIMGVLKKKVNKLGQEDRKYESKMNKCVLEAFGGIKEVKITHSEEFFKEDYYNKSTAFAAIHIRKDIASIIPKQVIEVVCIGSLMLSLSIRIYMGADLSTFIPIVSVFAVAAFRLLPSVNKITNYMNSILFHKPGFIEIYNSIDLFRSPETNQVKEIMKSANRIKFDNILELRNLSYHYPDSDKNVLENINIKLKKNESIGLIGPSGAGKTTLADIILGVLEATSGELIVDDEIINENLYNWQKNLGYIPQSIFLSDDTIRNNIAFGIRKNEIDDKMIWKAIEEAQLKDFVESLPDGIDTRIGERGARLSGGQKQRIGIARALYYNPDVLVLDEATSALDNETEKAVMEAIEKLQGNKTMIIIAHRLTTVQHCDSIYEVKSGAATLKNKKEIFGK